MKDAVQNGLHVRRLVGIGPVLCDGGGLLEAGHDGEHKETLVIGEGPAVLLGHVFKHVGKKRTKGGAPRGGIPALGKLERVGVPHEDRGDAEDDPGEVIGIALLIQHDGDRITSGVHQDLGENGGIADRRKRHDGAARILFGHRKFHPLGPSCRGAAALVKTCRHYTERRPRTRFRSTKRHAVQVMMEVRRKRRPRTNPAGAFGRCFKGRLRPWAGAGPWRRRRSSSPRRSCRRCRRGCPGR